mmetsp:Transcript_46160/g.86129  ORF Transcript_46160/g.86129 Transcript_46160/m.86129 type:complete len:266 (-) Transcript_46160:1073-1870(-)
MASPNSGVSSAASVATTESGFWKSKVSQVNSSRRYAARLRGMQLGWRDSRSIPHTPTGRTRVQEGSTYGSGMRCARGMRAAETQTTSAAAAAARTQKGSEAGRECQMLMASAAYSPAFVDMGQKEGRWCCRELAAKHLSTCSFLNPPNHIQCMELESASKAFHTLISFSVDIRCRAEVRCCMVSVLTSRDLASREIGVASSPAKGMLRWKERSSLFCVRAGSSWSGRLLGCGWKGRKGDSESEPSSPRAIDGHSLTMVSRTPEAV